MRHLEVQHRAARRLSHPHPKPQHRHPRRLRPVRRRQCPWLLPLSIRSGSSVVQCLPVPSSALSCVAVAARLRRPTEFPQIAGRKARPMPRLSSFLSQANPFARPSKVARNAETEENGAQLADFPEAKGAADAAPFCFSKSAEPFRQAGQRSRATRKPTKAERNWPTSQKRKALRAKAGVLLKAPARTMRRLQSPLAQAEPSFGAPR